MSIKGGPNIVTDGLVLHLDAADSNSYSGSGFTWIDLSGNGNDGTLVNGVGYSSNNVGNLSFDGSNDYCDFFAPNLENSATVEMWCKIGSNYSAKMFFGWLRYDIWCSNGHIGYNTGNGDIYGISATTASNLGVVNNWKHYIFEMRSNLSYINNKIYINTSLQSLSQQLGSENSGNRSFNSGYGRISGWKNDTNYPIPMSCSLFKVYNRILDPTEIAQNYNKTKGRFGL